MVFWFGKKKNNGEIEPVRPWGNFEIVSKINKAVIKKITVKPLAKLSYQSHYKRAEHWFILNGQGKVTLDDTIREIRAGESIDIPPSAKHRIENVNSQEDLTFIEISTGDFDENDIIRYKDEYGRK